jgi:hypothetical protein
MSTSLTPLTLYDPASHIDAAHLPRRFNEPSALYLVQPKLPLNYAGLWPILAGQNASVDMAFLVTDLFEAQGIDGVVTGGWGLPPRFDQALGTVTGLSMAQARKANSPKRISLAEGQRLATEALLQAEARRQDEREREAAFWAAMEDEQ